jgi:hypothetical protein
MVKNIIYKKKGTLKWSEKFFNENGMEFIVEKIFSLNDTLKKIK